MSESLLEPIGYTLSAVVAIVAALIAVDVVRRRNDFPGLEHGRAAVSGRVMRWVWLVLLVASLGMESSPIFNGYTTSSGPPGLRVAMGEPISYMGTGDVELVQHSSRTVNLPFYRASVWSGESRDGRLFDAATRVIVLPFGFIAVALAYWFFVARAGRKRPGVQSE